MTLACLLNLRKHWNCSSWEYKQTNYIFVIWNWCRTKLDIATSWKTNKKFFHFLTWEPVEKNLTPLVFSNFLRNPQKIFIRKYGIHEGFNLWCFDGRIIVGGRPYPKLWGKYKRPYPRFHRFCYKNPLKIDFFHKVITSICFFPTYYCLILLYLYDFELKHRKQILKFFSVFDGFHSKIHEILDRVFCIFSIT